MMIFNEEVDVRENNIVEQNPNLLDLLLFDHSKKSKIIRATKIYEKIGAKGYKFFDSITPSKITGKYGLVIRPRTEKTKNDQKKRSRDNAEVFTPSWICNLQNNLVDEAWFGYKNVFNFPVNDYREINNNQIVFPKGKTWKDYIYEKRMEVSCGEAPYLVSRYDTTTGKIIKNVNERIGLLDRKYRIINENVNQEEEWFKWAKIAHQSVYGYEWQGDNLLIARENVLYTFIDNYRFKFGKEPGMDKMEVIAEIISWNLWQMDGIKGVIPGSCPSIKIHNTLFGINEEGEDCPGCKNPEKEHKGIHCIIKDWENNKKIDFSLLYNNNINGGK